ncbi:hypothetical protein [Agromyces ramosus]|uniref:Alternate signal-mediated exported protein n=1 Tax=Agromyces ramosus TaxID=33879 RepID=A0ABU0RE14_9MICO|nr:hypothetical protein [Agromyces ramosus]MDQ0895511.1 hypothetical protein [Agromyces ramosus]
MPRPRDPSTSTAVIAASRGRRRSRRSAALGVAATAAVVLAVGGLATVVNVLGPNAASQSALTSESAADTAPEAGSEARTDAPAAFRLAAPEQVNLCGAPVAAATDASGSGLVVTVEPPAALAPGATGDARVTVTNAGSTPVAGELRIAPALTIAGDGITRWHTNGAVADALTPVTLEPGASATLDGPVTAVACSSDDELAKAFPPALPPLVPGDYAVTAVVMFIDHETGAIDYLVSPLAPLQVL